MNDEQQKAQARREERDAYHRHLEQRIPELQGTGKPAEPKGELTMAQRIGKASENLKLSQYPGRKARDQADREWAAMKGAA